MELATLCTGDELLDEVKEEYVGVLLVIWLPIHRVIC